MKLLEGKAVAMTGGGSGLGLCYGVAMAKAGAAIAVSDIKRLLAAGFVYQPDEFSNVVVFPASDLSSPLNGEFISLDLHR